MRDNDSNKGIGGLLDPGRASKEDLRREKLNKFYRDHIENSKPHTPHQKALSITDYMPTPTLMTPTVVKPIVKKKEQPFRYEGWAEGIMDRTEPKNKFGHTASQKDKELIKFVLENSSEPVIKNKLMRTALEAKPLKLSKKNLLEGPLNE